MPCLSKARVVTSPPIPPPTTTTLFNAVTRSFRLRPREFHDLLPFFGFRSNERSEIGRRACECRAAEAGKLGFYPGIGKSCVELAIERRDDLGRRVAWRADAVPLACLEAWHEIRDRRKIGQRLFSGNRGH